MNIRLNRYVPAACAGALLSAGARAVHALNDHEKDWARSSTGTIIMFNRGLTPVFPGATTPTSTGF